jgi:hypothetical protein
LEIPSCFSWWDDQPQSRVTSWTQKTLLSCRKFQGI